MTPLEEEGLVQVTKIVFGLTRVTDTERGGVGAEIQCYTEIEVK